MPVEVVDRDAAGAGDVPGRILGVGSDIDDDDVVVIDAPGEFGSSDRLEPRPITEIISGERVELVMMRDRNVPQRSPQRTDPWGGQPVMNPVAVPAGADEACGGEGAKVERRVGDALVDLCGEFLDVAFALFEHVDQLEAAPRRQRLGHLGEPVEECRLRLVISNVHLDLPPQVFKCLLDYATERISTLQAIT
ncbi:MAG: hypothetical protein R2715_24910 [Ilumatobacteraceae bacterium]